MQSFLRRHRKALLLLALLLPTILFSSAYAAGTASGPRSERYVPAQGDWTVNMTLVHPGYVVPGQTATLTVKVGITITNPNVTVGVTDVIVELRNPTVVNSTSGVVEGWGVLGTAQLNVNKNFSHSTSLTKSLTLLVSSPPGGGATDLFFPASQIAFNGIVDLNVYETVAGVTTSNPQSVSLLDSATFYQTQLSYLLSTSSWLTYQLISSLVVGFLFVRTRPPAATPQQTNYAQELKRFKAGRALSHLDELKKAGKIGEARYAELKEEYERETGGGASR